MAERSFRKSIEIPRPADEVFARLADPTSASRWMDEVVRVEPLTDEPVGVGWRFKETRLFRGRECAAVIEVTEYRGTDEREPYVVAMTSRGLGNRATYRFTTTPEADGCRVDLEASVVSESFLGRFATGIMWKAITASDGDLLERFAGFVGSEVAAEG